MNISDIEMALRNYKANQVRVSACKVEIEYLEKKIGKAEESAIEMSVNISPNTSGMPHGSSVGDPVGMLAQRVADGAVPIIAEMKERLKKAKDELCDAEYKIRTVDTWMECLTEYEEFVIHRKYVDAAEWTWAILSEEFNKKFGHWRGKKALQRLEQNAMANILSIAKNSWK